MSSLHRRESEVSEKHSEDSYEASIQQEEGKAEWSESIIPKSQDAFGQPCARIESHHTSRSVSSFQAKFPGLKKTASNVLTKVESRMTTKSIVDPGPPPDGGLLAWTQVLMAWITVFSTWGYVNSFGAFQTYYTDTLHIAPSTVSWIGSVQVWILFFVGVFSGRALDAGYFLPTFLIGVVIQLIGIFMMSLSKNYWQLFLTQGVATGIGGGIFFCPALALVNTYFSKNRGIAVGISSTGNATGGMIYPIIVRQLLPKVGFAWTVRTIGFLNLFCLCIVLYFMKPRLPPRKSGPIIEFSAFKDPVYAFFVWGMFFIIGPLYFTFYYIASFGREIIHLPYSQSVTLLILLNGIGIPARLLPGLLADRYFGAMNSFIPLLFLNALLVYCWLGVSSTGSFYAWTCAYGMASAAFQSLFPTTVASLTANLNTMGTRLGMAFSVMAFAGLTGPPLGGALNSTVGGKYYPAQIWAGTSTLLGCCLITAARYKRYGWVLKKC